MFHLSSYRFLRELLKVSYEGTHELLADCGTICFVEKIPICCMMSVSLQNCSRHVTAEEAGKNVHYVCYLTHYFKTFIWKAKKAKEFFVHFVLSFNWKVVDCEGRLSEIRFSAKPSVLFE